MRVNFSCYSYLISGLGVTDNYKIDKMSLHFFISLPPLHCQLDTKLSLYNQFWNQTPLTSYLGSNWVVGTFNQNNKKRKIVKFTFLAVSSEVFYLRKPHINHLNKKLWAHIKYLCSSLRSNTKRDNNPIPDRGRSHST